jgi:hypothetical protein
VNGVYPLRKVPAKAEFPGERPYITLLRNGAYVSEPIGDAVNSGETVVLESRRHWIYSVMIDSVPKGAPIFVDGYPTGFATPWQVNLSDGPHRIMLARAGYLPVEKQITLPQDGEVRETQELYLPLEEFAAGHLQVQSNPPEAKIYLSGRDTGEKTPHTFAYLPIGSYDLRIVGKTSTKTIEDVVVTPNLISVVNVSLGNEGS